ncbi:MAG: class A beta-lactamase-related serine hydrolase [Anaerolineales bacterium]|nr:class A beta-lactamase-related serine hydrolase [Anaerolineales bacterium]
MFERLENFLSQFTNQTVGVALRDFESGAEFYSNADVLMHPASTMKIPVMMEVFRQADAGLLSFDERLTIYNSFVSIADGSSFALDEADDSESALYRRVGESETVRELTRLMIVRSSNLASNLLMDKVSTARVNAIVKECGVENMSVIRGLEDKKALALNLNNAASARSSLRMLELIAEGNVVSPSACAEMIRILSAQEFNESIPALLPNEVKVAHKTGWSENFFHDIGVIFPPQRKPYVLALFTHGFPENKDYEAHQCMAQISKIIYEEIA